MTQGTPGLPETRDPEPDAARSKWKKRLIIAGVAVGLLLASYVTGRLQTHSAIGTAEHATEQAKTESTRAHTSAETAKQLVDRLEGRRHLDLALRQIDHRNFGTAADELRAAAALLQRSQPTGDLDKLAKDLSAYRLIATEDVNKQREQVLAMVDRFDQLVPPAKP